MSVIRGTPEDLERRAQMLDECIRQFHYNLQNVERIVSSLRQEWESLESEQYQDRIGSLMPYMDQMIRVLAEYSGDLKRTAEEYASYEQSAAAVIRRELFL